MDLVCVTVDCGDPRVVAEFWYRALGWDGVVELPGGEGFLCTSAGAGVFLEFVPVPETKLVKNRVHLGCHVEQLGALDAEVGRPRGLGASVAWEEAFPDDVAASYRNIVMRDVEGNEFCLGAGRPPG